jgi:hypothetical protein
MESDGTFPYVLKLHFPVLPRGEPPGQTRQLRGDRAPFAINTGNIFLGKTGQEIDTMRRGSGSAEPGGCAGSESIERLLFLDNV